MTDRCRRRSDRFANDASCRVRRPCLEDDPSWYMVANKTTPSTGTERFMAQRAHAPPSRLIRRHVAMISQPEKRRPDLSSSGGSIHYPLSFWLRCDCLSPQEMRARRCQKWRAPSEWVPRTTGRLCRDIPGKHSLSAGTLVEGSTSHSTSTIAPDRLVTGASAGSRQRHRRRRQPHEGPCGAVARTVFPRITPGPRCRSTGRIPLLAVP